MNSNTTVGIDRLHMYSPHYYIDLEILARAKGLPDDAYTKGIGQNQMAIAPPDEDVVTMGANAASAIISACPNIDMLIFATESSVDQSKSAGTFVHQLLNLPNSCRVFEIKQACYAATAALHMACNHVRVNPNDNVLIIAADIAKYALDSTAEPSQGAGAIAMLIKSKPALVAIENESGFYTEDKMDFWRPPYQPYAFVDGKQSCELYLKLVEKTWFSYVNKSKRRYEDHDFFCFHTPVPKLAQKAHKWLARHNDIRLTQAEIIEQTNDCLAYSRKIGNTYTASLYISLLSLLDHHDYDCSGKRIGFYSYGSGCVGEFFSGVIQPGYADVLATNAHQEHINSRHAVDYHQYRQWNQFSYAEDGSRQQLSKQNTSSYRLDVINEHKRLYEVVSDE